jgi:hypothetical protein
MLATLSGFGQQRFAPSMSCELVRSANASMRDQSAIWMTPTSAKTRQQFAAATKACENAAILRILQAKACAEFRPARALT